jgi:hypothetical protein
MLEELARLHAEVPNLTVIYVTYDQSEALTIADRIGMMRNGVLRITLPLLLPYLIAAWSLSFAFSRRTRRYDHGLSPGWATLPVGIFALLDRGDVFGATALTVVRAPVR